MNTVAVPREKWGRDHASLLAYVESCTVNGVKKAKMPGEARVVAELDKRRLRCNEKRHPMHAVNLNMTDLASWKPTYGTRCAGDHVEAEHDDWDVLNDLESAGLVDVISEANAFVLLTAAGAVIASRIREHKAKGKQFREFVGDAWLP
jgi:hypothetical protein